MPGELAAAALATSMMKNDAQNRLINGQTDNSPSGLAGRAQNAFSSGGLTEIPGVGGVVKSVMGGKNGDQQGRDLYRDLLRQVGIYDNEYNYQMTDGSLYNMGLDGSVKNYNVDFSIPGMDKYVAYVSPLARMIVGNDEKKANDLTGELANMIAKSKNPLAEAQALYKKAGITKDQLYEGIDNFKVDDSAKNVYKATVNELGIPGEAGGQNGNNDMVQQSNELARIRAATQGYISKLNSSASAATRQAMETQKQAQANQQKSSLINNLLGQASASTAPISYPTHDASGTLQKITQGLPQPKQMSVTPDNAQPQMAASNQFNGALQKILTGG